MMPPLLDQARNFARSIAVHAANGFAAASPDEARRRLDICNGCDRLEAGRCNACGCYVSRKASWASERCPLGKWGRMRVECGGVTCLVDVAEPVGSRGTPNTATGL